MRVATKWVKEMLNATAVKCAGHSILLRALKGVGTLRCVGGGTLGQVLRLLTWSLDYA